ALECGSRSARASSRSGGSCPSARPGGWSEALVFVRSPTTELEGDGMPGLAGRMSTVIKAKISKLLDRAEDPAETLDYGYQKQVESLQNVKKGIADVVTAKKRLQMQSQKYEQQVVKLDTQARQALSQGREDLARAALERKAVIQGELQSLDTQVKEL